MNPEPLLESATWPVFIANEAGTIRRANAAAVNFFGRQLEHGNVRLEDVWGTSNDLAATEFLAKLKVSHSSIMPLRFRSQETANLQFLSSVCRLERGDLLFQLFPQPPPGKSAAPAGAGGSDKTVEVNLAQKQKLECAMQLTRTVALDFNNALTTILGHVSYVLSKMESSNPWRRSLVEVEKAAERAGEIVQSLETFGTDDKGTRTQIAGNLNALLRRTVELFQTPQNSS